MIEKPKKIICNGVKGDEDKCDNCPLGTHICCSPSSYNNAIEEYDAYHEQQMKKKDEEIWKAKGLYHDLRHDIANKLDMVEAKLFWWVGIRIGEGKSIDMHDNDVRESLSQAIKDLFKEE